MGFHLNTAVTIRNCTASENQGGGIDLLGDAVVQGNVVDNNGGPGISFAGRGNLIAGNKVTRNTVGYYTGFPGNFIVKNIARENGTNWTIAAGNVILV